MNRTYLGPLSLLLSMLFFAAMNNVGKAQQKAEAANRVQILEKAKVEIRAAIQEKGVENMRPGNAEQEKPEEKKSEEQKLKDRLIESVEAAAAAELKRVYAATLRAEINEMAELFDLKEVDVRKLGVAARGAASKNIEKQRTSIMATVKRMLDRKLNEPDVNYKAVRFNGKPLDLGVEKKPDADPDEDDDKDPGHTLGVTVARRSSYFYFTVRYQSGSSSTTIGSRGTQLRNEEIWKKTTGTVLKPDMVKKYDEHRKKKLKATVIDMMLAALRYELHLKNSQIPKVRQRLDKQIKITTTQIYVESIVSQFRQQLKTEDFKDVLTPPQVDLWESSQAYYRRYLQ